MDRNRPEPGPDLTWLLLVACTGMGVVAYRSQGPAAIVAGVLLALALLKARMLCLGFLKLGTAPAGWRRGIAIGMLAVVATAWLASALGAYS